MSVGRTVGPVARPSADRDIDELLARVEILERMAGGGWRFNVDNEGGSGYVGANSALDLADYPDPLAAGGSWGLVFEDDSGQGLLFGSNLADVVIRGRGGNVSLLADGVPVAAARFVQMEANGAGSQVQINLLTVGTAFVVNDHDGNPIFRVDEDGTPHIKTGETWLADL